MTITELLDKLEAADAKAAVAPWLVYAFETDLVTDKQDEYERGTACVLRGVQRCGDGESWYLVPADAALIATSRNALPGLLAWAREAQTLLRHYHDGTGFRPGLTLHQQVHTLLARDIEVPGD